MKKVVILLSLYLVCLPAIANPLLPDANRMVIPPNDYKSSYNNIRYLTVMEGAPENLFDAPPLKFPNLKEVYITESSATETHLGYLLKHYPWIGNLGIKLKHTVSEDIVQKFYLLTSNQLAINFPTKSPDAFAASLPKSLKLLLIGQNSNLIETSEISLTLPKLSKLDIRGAKVDADFLKNSNLPSLKELQMVNVSIAKGQLNYIEKCQKLKQIILIKTPLNDDSLTRMKALHIRVDI
jgi:hypothetical protein